MRTSKIRKTEYTTVSIPVALHKRIQNVIQHFGYVSVADLCREALRVKVEAMENELDEASEV